MRILVYSSDIASAEWVKDTLNDFGRGMHIVTSSTSSEVLLDKWAYIIILGDENISISPTIQYSCLPLYTNQDEQQTLRRQLWQLYRDTLQDLIGNRCSCGMYDFCHCH